MTVLHFKCLPPEQHSGVLSSFPWSVQCVEVRLDPDYLTFGAVMQRCMLAKRLVLRNHGDIGAGSVPCTLSISLNVSIRLNYNGDGLETEEQ